MFPCITIRMDSFLSFLQYFLAIILILYKFIMLITMEIRKIMSDLLHFTKKIADRIKYYDAIIDFSEETHWFNPFYSPKDVVVIWAEDEPFNKY